MTNDNTAILDIDEDHSQTVQRSTVPRPLRLSSMAEMNGLRARLMSRTVMLQGQDLPGHARLLRNGCHDTSGQHRL